MAKIRYIAICFLLVLNWHYSFGQDLRQQVEQTYLSQLGVREKGHNAGEQVSLYLSVTGMKPGAPWCAAFVAYVYTVSGVPNPKSAWSPAWFSSKYVVWSYTGEKKDIPQPGDVFGIYYTEKKRIAHVGFIHRFGENITVTVEGNTNKAGSREGDGVYMKRRPTRQIYKVARYINK